jgi:hypothetical protein
VRRVHRVLHGAAGRLVVVQVRGGISAGFGQKRGMPWERGCSGRQPGRDGRRPEGGHTLVLSSGRPPSCGRLERMPLAQGAKRWRSAARRVDRQSRGAHAPVRKRRLGRGLRRLSRNRGWLRGVPCGRQLGQQTKVPRFGRRCRARWAVIGYCRSSSNSCRRSERVPSFRMRA